MEGLRVGTMQVRATVGGLVGLKEEILVDFNVGIFVVVVDDDGLISADCKKLEEGVAVLSIRSWDVETQQ
jgi:hypothetical protein